MAGPRNGSVRRATGLSAPALPGKALQTAFAHDPAAQRKSSKDSANARLAQYFRFAQTRRAGLPTVRPPPGQRGTGAFPPVRRHAAQRARIFACLLRAPTELMPSLCLERQGGEHSPCSFETGGFCLERREMAGNEERRLTGWRLFSHERTASAQMPAFCFSFAGHGCRCAP